MTGSSPTPRNVLFISRQRIVGATNGSSTYLIDLARAVRDAGMIPHLLQPSPTITGRWPTLNLRPEMRVFETHTARGLIRIGDRLISRSPRVYWAIARAGLAKAARRVGIRGRWAQDQPLPHTITIPWTAADHAFVRRESRDKADIAIADYMFCTEAFASLADPSVPNAVVMHDLFHARESKAGDTVPSFSYDREMAMLGKADAVIAIQSTEAAFLAEHLPTVLPILAPMAARPVATPQPGDRDRLLFVGSNTGPNIVGLQWLFETAWPIVMAQWPDAKLDIAGTVARAFPTGGPKGVRFLGLVDDLQPLYASAGIILSPLTFGSGLKIKLIEAMAEGKAIVATPVTLQGVERECEGAVACTDDPQTFADHILRLHEDAGARADLAAAALVAARQHFSAEACYGDFAAWLNRTAS